MWTPTIVGSTSGNATYIHQHGKYYKIGNSCHITFLVSVSSHNLVGTISIGNPPFYPKPNSSPRWNGPVAMQGLLYNNITLILYNLEIAGMSTLNPTTTFIISELMLASSFVVHGSLSFAIQY